MAGQYKALLIGNSTYPADEHNLQTLKGPVKDIAALNRALIDLTTGLFADVDVTLLPEATSSRAIRALGRFFGSAARDDVLLVYFSGHGKLDQNGRLHLCMQDTESTDLLSTAVSSTRINEFADASRARNVIIVLDCCHAGAFRGADLGDAVAGPGRYVLTSCRGTQLANDATVDNGTSHFTQHLVDGLLGAAAGQDRDGYVTFSDLYAYVSRRLREAGKQIPQRRVTGDGDVPLARRSLPLPADTAAPMTPHSVPAAPVPADAATPVPEAPVPAAPQAARRRRRMLLAVCASALLAGGAAAAVALATGGSAGHPDAYVASGPWRLKVNDGYQGHDPGCAVTLTDARSGQPVLPPLTGLYGTHMYQIQQTGSFRWRASDQSCAVTALDGAGNDQLPLYWGQIGDTDAFAAPARLAVHVKDYASSPDCTITLRDATNGQPVDAETATPGHGSDTVVLETGGHPTVYLSDLSCKVEISRAP